MPTYIYRCPQGHVTEREYRMGEEKPDSFTCHCKEKAKRQWTMNNPIFKGEGFTKSNS